MFKTDYSKKLVEKGSYEVQIIEAELLQAETGTKYMQLALKVREDVEQLSQGEVVYEKLWQNKTTGEYNQRRFNSICKSAGIPEGTTFKNENDFLNTVKGKILIANIDVVFDDFRSENVNTVLYYNSSEIPFKTVGGTAPATKTTVTVEATEPKVETSSEEDDFPW